MTGFSRLRRCRLRLTTFPPPCVPRSVFALWEMKFPIKQKKNAELDIYRFRRFLFLKLFWFSIMLPLHRLREERSPFSPVHPRAPLHAVLLLQSAGADRFCCFR